MTWVRATVVLVLVLSAGGCAGPVRPAAPWDPASLIASVEAARIAARRDPSAAGRPVSARTDEAFSLQVAATRAASQGNDSPPAQTSGEAETPPPTPRAGFLETAGRDLRALPAVVWKDARRVYGQPTNLAILGVTYGGSLALQRSGPDDRVERHYRRHDAFDADWRDAFGALGNPGAHFAVAGLWFLAGHQADDPKTHEVGRTLLSALAVNGLSVMLGQAATSDRAPNGEWGTFPSGHTSSTFCLASVMHEAYGPWIGLPLYGLGALVAVERLDDGEHYLSDVVFGAVLGTVIGHSVASGRDPEFFGWRLVPYADPARGATGLALVRSF